MSTDPGKKTVPPTPMAHADSDSSGLSSGGDPAPAAPAVPGPASDPAPVTPPALEPIGLPKGAFIAFRKSGGIKFTSSEMLLYPDGRITYGGAAVSRDTRSRSTRKLNDAQIMRLRRTLDQSGFFDMKSPAVTQSPDTYAFELAARVGARHNAMELFTGAVPASVQPLIEQLEKLLPHD